MQNINDFLKDLKTNDTLKKAFESTSDLKEVCRVAKQHGYEISEDDLMDYYLESVSGGAFVDKSSYSGSIYMDTDGDGNVQINTGSVTVSGGNVNMDGVSTVDPMAVLKMLFGR